jgi:peptide/nickel transport system substrate-binding protein
VNWPFIASPKAVANPELFTKGTYGAGPYMLNYSASVPGDHYLFVPNPYYYDKPAIKFRQIYVKVFADPASMLQALQAGQIDAIAQADASLAPAAEKAGFQVVSAPYATTFVQLNPKGAKPLADVRVRQAMNYALDRNAIAKALYGKYGSPTSQFLTTGDGADPGLQNYYAYNPTKAKQLLGAAGYPNGFPFTLSFIPTQEKLAGLVAHYLDAVGVKTKLAPYATSAAYFEMILKFKDDAWMLAAGNGGQTPSAYGPFIGPTSSFRPGEPVNPKVDRLYYTGLKSRDSLKYWKQMWGMITTEAWFLPTVTVDGIWLTSKSLDGVAMSKRRPTAYAIEWSFK